MPSISIQSPDFAIPCPIVYASSPNSARPALELRYSFLYEISASVHNAHPFDHSFADSDTYRSIAQCMMPYAAMKGGTT